MNYTDKTRRTSHDQHDDWDYNHNEILAWQAKHEENSAPEITAKNDPSEKEADDVAQKFVSGETVNLSGMSGAGNTVQPSANADAPTPPPDFNTTLNSSKGSGQSLDAGTQSEMESKMGSDFGDVRVHTGSQASGMAGDISAKAFTHGQDIYFGEGQYNPGSKAGKELLAHELTHTVQQGKGLSRKIQRTIDQAGSIKVIQAYYGATVTGAWDAQTTTALQGRNVDASNHGAIIDNMMTGIVGESRVALQNYSENAAKVLPHLQAAQKLSGEGVAISSLAEKALNGYPFTIENLKQGLPLVLNRKLVLPATVLDDNAPVPGFFNATGADFKKNIDANQQIVKLWPRLKGEKVEADYTPAPFTQDEITEATRKETITVPPAVGDAKRSSEEIAAEAFSEFYAADTFLFGGKKTQEYSASRNNNDVVTMANLSERLMTQKGIIISQLTQYDPKSYDDKVKYYQDQKKLNEQYKADYAKNHKGEESKQSYKDRIAHYNNNIETCTTSIPIVESNKKIHINNTCNAIGNALTEITRVLTQLIFYNTQSSATKAIEEYNRSLNATALDKEQEEKRATGLADPQNFQKLLALVIDNLDISLSNAGILSIHFDNRLLPSRKDKPLTDYIEEAGFVNSTEKMSESGAFTGVILYERGNQKTVLLSLEAFDSRQRLETVVNSAVNAKAAEPRVTIYKKKVFKPDDADDQAAAQTAIATNNARWTDPRSVRIIQDVVGAPITGTFDVNTVDYIAHWQDVSGVKGTPGIVELNELRSMFGELTGSSRHMGDSGKLEKVAVKGTSYNSAIQLILDYFNFYDEMEKLDENGRLIPNAPAKPARTEQSSDEVLSMYYRKDSDITSSDDAAATYPSSYSPSLVMLGAENISSFDDLVTTIAHELVHVKQHTAGSKVPRGATELFPEMMEVSGKFGNVQLPGRGAYSVSQDYMRGAREYLKLNMSDSKKYRQDRQEIHTIYKKNQASGIKDAQDTIDKYKKEQEDKRSAMSSTTTFSSTAGVSVSQYASAMDIIQREKMSETTLPLLDAAYDFVDQPYDVKRLTTLQEKFVPFSGAEWTNYGDYPDTTLADVKDGVNADYALLRAQLFQPLKWVDDKIAGEKATLETQKATLVSERTTLNEERSKLMSAANSDSNKISELDTKIKEKDDAIAALDKQITQITTEHDSFKKAVGYNDIQKLHSKPE